MLKIGDNRIKLRSHMLAKKLLINKQLLNLLITFISIVIDICCD